MIALIFKIFLKLFLIIFSSVTYAQQNPFTFTDDVNHKYIGAVQRPGTAAVNCPRWLQMDDSTLMWLFPPALRVNPGAMYMDSLMTTPSKGSPTMIPWVSSVTGQFQWSTMDSLRLPASQITGLTTGTVTSIGITSTDFSVSGSPVTASGNITTNLNTSGISAGKYIIGTYNNKGIATAGTNPTLDTISSSRSFGSVYQMSTTSWVDVRINASVSCSLSLTGGQSGEIYLEYSADGSTNWTMAGKTTASNTGTLTIGLATSQLSGGQITVMLPPSYWWRARTNNITGTPTYTFLGGIKIIY